MSTLYELTEEYQVLLAMAEDPDTDTETLADTFEGPDGEIEEKAEGYAKVMRQIAADEEEVSTEIKRLQDRKKKLDQHVKTMKTALQTAMETTGKRKFKTPLFSFNIQKNPAHIVMDTDDFSKIPIEYLKMDPVVDKEKIKTELKNGAELDFAHLEQDESLRIR